MAAVNTALALGWTWNGNGGNGNWSTAGNWTGNGSAPASASTTDLAFAGSNNTGTALVPLNQNIGTPFLLNSLSFNNGAGSFFLGGGALRFDGGIDNSIIQNSSSAQNIANAINAPSSNSTVTITLTGNGTGVVTMSGVIASGSGQRDIAITKTGTSTFTLSGANTYGGLTTITSGVLNIQNSNALGSTGSGTSVASGAALQLQGGISVGSETLALNGSGIAGDGALRNISGNNGYAGGVSLGSASTIASDSGTLTLFGGIVNGGFTATFAGSGNVTSSGVLSGTGALIKNGGGTLTLSGVNTYSGGSTLNGGTTIINSASSLGATGGSATINAATLDIAATFTTTRNYVLGNANSTILVDPAFAFTANGVFSGTGTLNKTGTGTLVLGGANSFSGATNISAGTLRDGTTNVIPDASAVTVANGATFDLNSFSETIGSLAGSGTVTSGAAGSLTLTAGGDNTSTVFSGLLQNGSGTMAFTKSGTGTLTLSGANTYSGLTIVSGGILDIQNASALGATAGGTTVAAGAELQFEGNIAVGNEAVTLNGTGTSGSGALRNISGNNSLAGGITLGSASTISSDAGTLTLTGGIVNGGFAATFGGVSNITESGVISGTGALNKTGSGTLVLGGANTYTGATNVSAGTLQISANERIANTSNLNVSGGTFDVQTFSETLGAVTLSSGTISGTATGTLTGSSYTLQSGTVSAILAGNTTVTKNTVGTVILSGANTYTGSTTISAGTLQVNTNNALGTVASGTTVMNGAVLFLNNVDYTTAEPLTINGSGISNGGALQNSGTSTFAGPINAATNATINAGGGTLNLTGGISKNGTTLTITGGGTVNVTTNGITGAAPNSDLVVDGTTVVLSAPNSYNGPTTIQNSGAIKLGNSNVLPTSPQTALTINTSSVLDLASYSDGVASLTGDSSAIVKNSVIGGTSTLTVNPATGVSTTFAGVIAGTNGGTQGNMAVQKDGAGTLVLTGANSYSGSTTVNGGTLTVANNSGVALVGTNGVLVNWGGTLMLGASDQINDTASLTLHGGTFAKGNFSEGSAGAPGMGALSLTASGSHIDFGTGTVGVLTFASFTPGAFNLSIDNWTGTANTVGNSSTDRLIFASDQSANLGSFSFTGYAPGAMEFDLGNGYWEVAPVPEASTWITGAFALALAGGQVIRRRQSCVHVRLRKSPRNFLE